MERCVSLADHPRRVPVLHAVAEHDNGWREEDRIPLFNTATGSIYDFVSAPLAVRHRVWPRGISRLASDPWAAALVAQHADTVYDRFHANADWTPFFTEVRLLRDELLREAGLPLEKLLADYGFVRIGDLISLVFCTGWSDEHRFGDVSVRLAGSRVVVTPDLFGGHVIPIEITARALPASRFQSAEELLRMWNDAALVTLRGEIAGTT